MLLAIDTATRIMSLALHTGDSLIAEQTLTIGKNHSEFLAPMIQQILTQCEVTMDEITHLAVSIGPGSYTGLRIGVSMAKGIAGVRNLPLVGVTTLDTLAAGQPFYNTRYTLVAVVPAGRGRIIAGSYRGKKGRWTPKDDPDIKTWDELIESLDERVYITGELNQEGLTAIAEAQSSDKEITLVTGATRFRRAGFLAEEAWRRINDKEEEYDFNPARVIPIYMKAPG